MKRAFTLIELLVVIGMLAVLVGAFGSSLNKARRRAKITRATQDAKEITNAILGFRNYAPNRSLVPYATGDWQEADEGSRAVKMILGGEKSAGNEDVPVLYNAQLVGGKIVDPWGNAYKIMVKVLPAVTSQKNNKFVRASNLPNFYRLTDEERQ